MGLNNLDCFLRQGVDSDAAIYVEFHDVKLSYLPLDYICNLIGLDISFFLHFVIFVCMLPTLKCY